MVNKNQLQQELETFDDKKGELVAQSRGKYVLIKGKRVIGTYDTESDAINEGYREFKNNPFLVKQILEVDPDYNFLSNLISV